MGTRGLEPGAYGALAGAGAGLGIALLPRGMRSIGLRLPLPAEAVVVGLGVPVGGSPTRPRGVLGRSLVLGLATGARSTLALVPPALGSGRTGVAVAVAGLVVTELTVDKLPTTPSRLTRAPLLGRLVLGAVGGASLARQRSLGVAGPAVAGAVGAAVGSLAGARMREVAAARGWTWQAAALEDGAALALIALAYRGVR
ncbi:MAG: hypothetical protein LH468_04115 [Nocardioides sp.]|nr:hypothetical protein [Nocardioides sp.]